MTDNRAYYDAFSERYDRGRDRGYHKLIDDQAAALVRRVGEGGDVLEVGCGTGLLLQRVAGFARTAIGIDLSPGMLERARARGLEVVEGSATALPFTDDRFDVAYSFKVLSHVPELERALAEMLRVVRPGGHIVFDIYNRWSLRYAIKRLFGPRATSDRFDEAAITTAFLSPTEVEAKLPSGARIVGRAGIRVVTPHPAVLALPGLRQLVELAEWRLMDSPAQRFAGFSVFTVEKRP
ncbi:MAG TPA: methyltransferase domain-containing protein [Nannocystaceae bacterium]|nr:methyltransferase domain-containing protein [Nannocystaceae bacterium]